MKLRTQVLLVLLLFAVLPIIVTISSNLPQVLELLSSLHRKVYLQDLRSDFRDLDEHLVARQEMAKLLSRLPEPGMMLGVVNDENSNQDSIDVARARYIEWINQVLPDQLDVIEIQFVDLQGNLRFWLERDFDSGQWRPTIEIPVMPETALITEVLALQHPDVKVSPIHITPDAIEDDPRHIMNLHLVSPLGFVPNVGATGAVIMTVDIGGMAQHFNKTLWSYDDGSYLEVSKQGQSGSTAFNDYPGLEEQFASKKIFLWEGGGQQIIWVPLMQTVAAGPLWVGRFVDTTSLVDFQSQLLWRVFLVVVVLLAVAWLVARFFAHYVDRLGQDLTNGISRLLEQDEKVDFTWTWSEELRQLGDKLTRLASAHVNNNKRLLQHAQELERSNRYKSEFLANVSHELRTPLNSIHLLSKMLADKKSGLPADKAEQAKVIHQASCDLKMLIDDILDLSKIEAKRAALNLENVNLETLLQDVIKLMLPQFEQKKLYLKLEISEQAQLIMNTDPDKLRQVLKNFLSNALKFTGQGGVVVSLLAGDVQLPVIISVRDSGIGIASDKHELIFQAFRQADGSTSRRYGGTGLGLSICRELTHLLGGRIELISDTGSGADFRIHLPAEFDRQSIRDEQLGVEEPLQLPSEPVDKELESVSFSGRQALIVDADVRNLLSLTTLLESWGIAVTGAGDAEETLEVLAEEVPDLLLMDVQMPADSGYDTIKKIRSSYACETLPLIVLTNASSSDERQSCMHGGASEYLARPVDAQELKKIFMHYLIKEADSE